MTNEQMLLAAAAVAVAFFPQIKAAAMPLIQGINNPTTGTVPTPPHQAGTNTSRPFPTRSSWVTSTLALQEELLAAKRDKAAALAGQLVIEIVNAQAAEGKR
jgi:hypothetical protein